MRKALARGAVGCNTRHGRWESPKTDYSLFSFVLSVPELASDPILLLQLELEACIATTDLQKTPLQFL